MLKSINIKNYAIIDNISIDFEKGFNVFTGQTGAGKSIIVGALTFLIKGKADPSIIKNGCDKAIVEGIFTLDSQIIEKLKENDIDYDDELIVRRVISNDGKNSIKVNDVSVTLNFLSDLLSNKIDIHSQKDSQYLLQKKNHRNLLDKYCDNSSLLKEYKDSYSLYQTFLDEYNSLLNNTYNESELEYFKFDLDELEAAKLSLEEEDKLHEQEKRYKSSEKYIQVLSNALNYFELNGGILDKTRSLIKELNLNDDAILESRANIENAYYALQDEHSKLHAILNSFNDGDIDIEAIEERLYLYSKLRRKHNLDTQGLIDKTNKLKEKIAFYENKDFVLNEKKKELDSYYLNTSKIADKLHKIRQNKALILENEIINHCKDLMLENIQFKIDLNKTDLNQYGNDDIEFLISLNKGEELKPLRNVASGGEISRVMLALKTVFTSLSDVDMAIFDEIDTGVSGKVALAMGKKMKAISKNTQVLTITHLAPVAACGEHHFFIYKDDDANSTKTMIKKLNYDQIIKELASISSTDISDNSIAAAKELYELAQSNK